MSLSVAWWWCPSRCQPGSRSTLSSPGLRSSTSVTLRMVRNAISTCQRRLGPWGSWRLNATSGQARDRSPKTGKHTTAPTRICVPGGSHAVSSGCWKATCAVAHAFFIRTAGWSTVTSFRVRCRKASGSVGLDHSIALICAEGEVSPFSCGAVPFFPSPSTEIQRHRRQHGRRCSFWWWIQFCGCQ
jgi:hypothetical protein